MAAAVFNNLDVRFISKKRWVLLRDLVFLPTGERVPAGYESDFASIPATFHGWPFYLSPFGKYAKAAWFHDHGYEHARERTEAERLRVDKRFLMMMKADGVNWFTRTLIYGRVRHFGALVFHKKRTA
jgi:hypothetical protein